MISSWVKVPVLSVHRTSMAPKFWMEFRRFTITRFRDMAIAPFARLIVTSIGSISGVRPTATAVANNKASNQSPLINPLMRKTAGTITAMNLIMSQINCLMPLSKLEVFFAETISFASWPNMVCEAVWTTTANPRPETTWLPIKQILGSSKTDLASLLLATFSTGMASPVKEDWLTNKSFVLNRRRSAGIRSPAESLTRSPGTSSLKGMSCSRFSRKTVTLILTSWRSFSAALLDLYSCKKAKPVDKNTIAAITSAPVTPPVTKEIIESAINSKGKGDRNNAKNCKSGWILRVMSMVLGPYCRSLLMATSLRKPSIELPNSLSKESCCTFEKCVMSKLCCCTGFIDSL